MTQTESRTETRLERHRETLRLAKGVGPMIRIDDLSPDEIGLVNADFLGRCQRVQTEDLEQIYGTYVQTLHSWGIMCPHPHCHRTYEDGTKHDTPIPFEESRWYSCHLCGTTVINR